MISCAVALILRNLEYNNGTTLHASMSYVKLALPSAYPGMLRSAVEA